MRHDQKSLSQLDLGLKPAREQKQPTLAPIELIIRIRTKREAYRKCIDESDLTLGEVAAYLEIDEAQFNRVLNGGGRHLDDDKELMLERICGNKIPTQWQAYQDGFELKPIRSSLERQLLDKERENEQLRAELDTLMKYGVIGTRR